MNKTIFITALLLAVYAASSQALHCYVCSTDTNSGCSHPEQNGISSTLCPDTATHCSTYTVNLYDDFPNVVRQCKSGDYSYGCTFSYATSTCVCDYNECNYVDNSAITASAATAKAPILLTLFTAACAIFLSFF